MKRVGIDTNIVLRSVVGDDPAQTPKARNFIVQTSEDGGRIYLNTIVLVETIWALRSTFKFSKEEIIRIVNGFLASRMELEEELLVFEALQLYRDSSADFSDCLILVRNQKAGVAETMTFDRKAAKVDGFSLLG